MVRVSSTPGTEVLSVVSTRSNRARAMLHEIDIQLLFDLSHGCRSSHTCPIGVFSLVSC